jgi:hypothetical protein
MAKKMATKKIDHYREPGSVLFFEYRCCEDHGSSDAEIWYRSHQKVTVLRCVNADDYGDIPQAERYEAGCPLAYLCRFADGLEWDLMEDELLDSEAEYDRPNPPTRPSDAAIKAARRAFGYKDDAFIETDKKIKALARS